MPDMTEPSMSHFPSKRVTLAGHSFILHGITAEDKYWSSIDDNYDAEFARLCQRLVQPDYICLDVGANIGVKTLYLARHCPQGRILAMEAGAGVAECLQANLVANDIHNATALHMAASDRNGTLTFAEASAWGHVMSTGVPVEAATLEEVVRRHDLQHVDFIKLDIEGFELPVLKNSLDLINRFETLVCVEFNSLTLLVWGNTNPREFMEWVCANFRYVYALNRASPHEELLTPVISTDECRAILHRNLVDDGCVTDLVMTNAQHRLTPSFHFTEQQLASSLHRQVELTNALAGAQSELRTLRAELERSHDALHALVAVTRSIPDDAANQIVRLQAAQQETLEVRALLQQALSAANHANTQRDAILTSTSWRLSAPLRRVLQRSNLARNR